MKSLSKLQVLAGLALLVSGGAAQQTEWGQCGGTGWTGPTTCAAGLVCNVVNEWYSQCIKGTGTTTVPPVPTTTPGPTTSVPPPPAQTGYVRTSGTRFTLNGQKYTPVGSNSYWIGLSELSDADLRKGFADIAAAGGTTVRTWGFHEATTTTPYGAYYQSWSGGRATVNTGATGLQSFDRVVAAAKANGIRLIVALTNNWSDYGGMDVYVNQIAGQGSAHDLFYTDSRIVTAFKSYVRAFVTRYTNEPTIMAWELANEPRCKGSTSTTSGTCTPATITRWATDIGAFIKSIDSNHLVALGDEGFYNQPGHASYPYQGGEGIDFDANLKIASMDFGTVHMYPEHWGESANALAWGVKWITDHAASMRTANKPVILEEYGMTVNKDSVYTQWLGAVRNSTLTGDLYWQAGSRYSWGNTHDDGYAVYPDQSVYKLLSDHARLLKARA